MAQMTDDVWDGLWAWCLGVLVGELTVVLLLLSVYLAKLITA